MPENCSYDGRRRETYLYICVPVPRDEKDPPLLRQIAWWAHKLAPRPTLARHKSSSFYRSLACSLARSSACSLFDSTGSTAGSNYFVRILSTLDREVLKPNTSVALHRHSHSVVEILPPESDSTIQLMQERPDVTYHDIGGMDMQKQEVN